MHTGGWQVGEIEREERNGRETDAPSCHVSASGRSVPRTMTSLPPHWDAVVPAFRVRTAPFDDEG